MSREPSGSPADCLDPAIEDFLDWHTEHAGSAPDARDEAAEALELLLAESGPDMPPDERAFYVCSPHRIQACASILRDSYQSYWVDKALSLLPGWTRWCASKTALDAGAPGRALAAARAEAAHNSKISRRCWRLLSTGMELRRSMRTTERLTVIGRPLL